MSCAKRELDKYYEQRQRANLRRDWYKYGIDHSGAPEEKVIPMCDWPKLEELVKKEKNTLFNILVVTDKEQLDYRDVYYDLMHNWFYYYYIDKEDNNKRKYDIIPMSKVVGLWPKDVKRYGGVISEEEQANSRKLDRDYYKLPRRDGRLDAPKNIFNF